MSERLLTWTAAALLRVVVLGLLWVFFAGLNGDYAVYGVVSVAICTTLSLWLAPPRSPVRIAGWPQRAWHAATLFLWFVWQSVLGGVDVALRSLRRPVRIEPAVVSAPFELQEGHARQLAMVMMNLMPGSMIQRTTDATGATSLMDGDGHTAEPTHVELHTLAAELDPAAQWQTLQHRVARAVN
ncbi:Na+/H+ antiporter subunit E [Nesterenkonia ebinurensis]|uniref:Na+/H+ antiporter subunit E n=1 Tax=Nesterenkonia ebinurensis TaxID=2608252 RepID=UPI00123DC442|nr:Na+/H+ antiporter subunit E [Nesterenkonia ebinurensis]